jgi:transposase
MQEYLSQLSKELEYEKHIINEGTMIIDCNIIKAQGMRVKTYYHRKVKDINYGIHKVILNIRCPKYYIERKKGVGSVAHSLDFVARHSQVTKRLLEYVIKSMDEVSANGLRRMLKANVVSLSTSTILRLFKKNLKTDSV